MITVNDIHALKDYYIGDLYTNVRAEQATDQSYIDDSFNVPEVRSPTRLVRSGIGNQVVYAPAEQIITSDPKASFTIHKGETKISEKLSREVNQVWMPLLRQQLPNIFKEAVKNKLARGENYVKVMHNERWVTGKQDRRGMPVLFFVPDPMIIYGSPEEDDCGWVPNTGVPNRVLVYTKRQVKEVLDRYPSWLLPKGKSAERVDGKPEANLVEWLEYWDKEVRYFEADGQPVLKDGIQSNPYGFTPFVRKYSGFGKRASDGQLSELIVSDIRRSRDLIREECAIRSDISTIMHIFAHKPVTFIVPSGEEVDTDALRQEFDLGAYSLNLLHMPTGWSKLDQDFLLPSREAFQHLANIRGEINQRFPFIMAGYPSGTSGRHEDLIASAGMRRYDTVVENTELEFGTAIEMALKICQKIPRLKPDGLKEEDLDAQFTCHVKLEAEDPIERDRKITLYDRLWNAGSGSIDLKTFLTEGQGRTEDEAQDIIARILVDKLTIYNPDVAEVMGMVFAEESGMEEWLNQAKQRRAQMEKGGGLQKQLPATGLERMQGETQTPMGREMADVGLTGVGARTPPERYTRGG